MDEEVSRYTHVRYLRDEREVYRRATNFNQTEDVCVLERPEIGSIKKLAFEGTYIWTLRAAETKLDAVTAHITVKKR